MGSWLHKSKQLSSLSRLLPKSGLIVEPCSFLCQSGYATLPNTSSKPRTSKQVASPEGSTDLSSGTAGKKVGTSRSPSSYHYFKKAHYEQLKSNSAQPIRISIVEKELAAKWKALSDEERQPYVAMTAVKAKKTPKKLNGYQFWMKTNVPDVMARNPKISSKQVFTSLGHEWKGMTDANKQVWKEKAEKEFSSAKQE
ncbi:TPA: hypothetical protein ACH3X1_006282 [Trebouxia sp. C0004]